MKTPTLLLAALLTAATAGAQLSPGPSTPTPILPATSVVRLKVEQESKSETDGPKRTQKRALKITLTNTGTDSLPLRVKYAFFGRVVGSHDTVAIDHSDLTTQLQPKAEQTLTTATQSATMTAEHYQDKKKVEASGQKFTGYGVKVYHLGKVIAEAFAPSSVADDMATMPGLPGPKPKPAAPAAKPAPKPAPKPATPAPSPT